MTRSWERTAGDDEEQVWPVPLTVAADGAQVTAHLVSGATGTGGGCRVPAQPDWFKVNPDQTGFYRVNYTDTDRETAGDSLVADRTLPATDRLGIQNDAFALSRAGLLPVTRFLALAESYQDETDASVWSDLATNLREIESLIADEPYLDAYHAFGRRLFAPAAQRSGWEAPPGVRATGLADALHGAEPGRRVRRPGHHRAGPGTV